ncbi:MAG: hypothetical protein ACR2NU_05720 [Aeoliella sp.]
MRIHATASKEPMMDRESKQEVRPTKETSDAKKLANALERKQGEQVKWTEEFAASGTGKPGATVEP